MTDKQRYRGLNRRFDNRSALLARFGFRYRVVFTDGECTTAVFERRPLGRRPQAVSAGTVMHADRTCWVEQLRFLLK